MSSDTFRLSRILDDEGRSSTRTHRESPGNRRVSVHLKGLDHRKCGRTHVQLDRARHDPGSTSTMNLKTPNLHADKLYFAALEYDDLAARGAYLDAACGTDTELRQRIERLL